MAISITHCGCAPMQRGAGQARIDTDAMIDASQRHQVVAWSPGLGASARQTFRAARDWVLRADVRDPAGDDHGPEGRYRYPTDPDFARLQPQDLRRVRVYTAGRALRVELDVAAISRAWAPANGFDHVAFTLFFALSGRSDGVAAMPQQFANLPDGLRWHYRLRTHGWSNAWFQSDGADADQEGRQRRPSPTITVVPGTTTVRFDWPAAAFDDVHSARPARLRHHLGLRQRLPPHHPQPRPDDLRRRHIHLAARHGCE